MPLPRLLGKVLDGKMENLPSDLIAQVTDAALNNHVLPRQPVAGCFAAQQGGTENYLWQSKSGLKPISIAQSARGSSENMKELTMSLDRNPSRHRLCAGRCLPY